MTSKKKVSLFSGIDLEGYSGLIEFPIPRLFAITMEGFINLVYQDYVQRSVMSYSFRNSISYNMYLYAMMIHFYGRLIALRLIHNSMTEHDLNLLSYLKTKPRRMSSAIQQYLVNIGSFRDDTQRHFHIAFPIWPNSNGDFGKITEQTHWKYMSYLSPRIIAYAITRDLAFSSGEGQEIWNIPADLQPDMEENRRPGFPTANFLGWRPAVNLTEKQILVLNRCITTHNFKATGPFFLNKQLFEYVEKKLRQVCPRSVNVFEHTLGNKGQIAFCEKEVVQSDKEPQCNILRTVHYTDLKTRLVSCSKLSFYTAAYMHLYKFRVRKEALQIQVYDSDGMHAESRHTWCIYDWDSYKNVPNSWIATRNNLFKHGDMEFYNYTEFYTRYYDKDYLSYLVWSNMIGRSYGEGDTSDDESYL